MLLGIVFTVDGHTICTGDSLFFPPYSPRSVLVVERRILPISMRNCVHTTGMSEIVPGLVVVKEVYQVTVVTDARGRPAFALNGQVRSPLRLVRGQQYAFDLKGVTGKFHFYIVESDDRGGRSLASGPAPGIREYLSPHQGETVYFTPTTDMPDDLYYQGVEFRDMGARITLKDAPPTRRPRGFRYGQGHISFGGGGARTNYAATTPSTTPTVAERLATAFQAPLDKGDRRAFAVRVRDKSEDSPVYRKGWPQGFTVNGWEQPALTLVRGETYEFRIDTPGHKFYLTTDPIAGAGWDAGGLEVMGASMDQGSFQFTGGREHPDRFHYQCSVDGHFFMGGPVTLVDRMVVREARQHGLWLEPVATGMTSPIGGTAQPGGDLDRLYVVDQVGEVWRIHTTHNMRGLRPFYSARERIARQIRHGHDLPGLDEGYDERGLLGFAFHPQYPKNQEFYTYESGEALPDPFSEGKEEEKLDHVDRLIMHERGGEHMHILWELPQANLFHNGGTLRFRPNDRRLYLATGDDGPQGEEAVRPQSMDNLYGKVLTFGSTFEPGGVPKIYAKGFRNPWSFTFSGDGKRMLVADVGFHEREAVYDVRAPDEGDIFNAGWPITEGSLPFNITLTASEPLWDPIIEYNHQDDKGVAITGVVMIDRDTRVAFCDYSGLMGVWDLERRELVLPLTRVVPVGHFIKGMTKGARGFVYLFVSEFAGPQGETGTMYRVRTGAPSEKEEMSVGTRQCTYCDARPAPLSCEQCHRVRYCSEECRADDAPLHVDNCIH